MSKCQESEPQADQTLFIELLKRIEPLGSKEGALCADRTRRAIVRSRICHHVASCIQEQPPNLNGN
jgi:single-stranded DNA-specific DHH superfamily exonuclease